MIQHKNCLQKVNQVKNFGTKQTRSELILSEFALYGHFDVVLRHWIFQGLTDCMVKPDHTWKMRKWRYPTEKMESRMQQAEPSHYTGLKLGKASAANRKATEQCHSSSKECQGGGVQME